MAERDENLSKDEDAEQEPVGYRNPPLASRFRKGQSGNPKGRPRGRSRRLPYEAVLGRVMIVRENGREQPVTAEVAILLKLTKDGLAGDTAAARAMNAAFGGMRGTDDSVPESVLITVHFVDVGTVNRAVEPLRIGTTLDRYRETARLVLEPWIVEDALARFGERRLTLEEQEVVLKATRTPRKVRWPDWWVVSP
jgi:Family of unknown function (DUF5681)